MSSRSARCGCQSRCRGARLSDAPEPIDVDQLVAPRAPSGWNIHIADCGGFIPPMAGEAAGSGPVAYRGLPATPPPAGDMSLEAFAENARIIAGEAAANVSSSPWVTASSRAAPWSAGPHPSPRPASTPGSGGSASHSALCASSNSAVSWSSSSCPAAKRHAGRRATGAGCWPARARRTRLTVAARAPHVSPAERSAVSA